MTPPLSQLDGRAVGLAASGVPTDATAGRVPWVGLRPYSSGVYVNFRSDEGAEGIRAPAAIA